MKIIFSVRSILMTVVFIFATIFFSICSLVNNLLFHIKKYDDHIIQSWAKVTCFIFNVKVKMHNTENIPNMGCVFLFNHSSFFDIFAMTSVLPDVRFGAKIELFKIPIFGAAIKRAGTLPIARGSREEVFKIYSEARPRIKNHERFALSPEGGRFYGKDLAPFKAGPFVFAITSGAVVAPVIIKGAYECLPKSSFLSNTDRWHREVNLYFLKSISTDDYAIDTRQDLQKLVYDQMNAVWVQSKI